MLKNLSLAFVAIFTLFLAGCSADKPVDIAAEMKPQPRPAELDELNVFMGHWEHQMEMKMAGSDQSMKCTGKGVIAWEADKWIMVEHMEGTMGDQTMKGLTIWRWDSADKVFRMDMYDNMGNIGTGKTTYDKSTGIWTMWTESKMPVSGKKSLGKGMMKMTGANTMEWSHTERDSSGNVLMEMKGTSVKR